MQISLPLIKKKKVLLIKETALWHIDRADSLDLGLTSQLSQAKTCPGNQIDESGLHTNLLLEENRNENGTFQLMKIMSKNLTVKQKKTNTTLQTDLNIF